VIHLWVDPRYGSDVLAFTYNPLPGSPTQFCGSGLRAAHPLDEFDPTSGLPLLHAPMPFRTVTRALQYLSFVQGPNGEAPFSPVASPYSSAYVIIHCLPGLYQDSAFGNPNYVDPHNGLRPNGETFPILLPNRVSIQGASALNTIFEPLLGVGPVFEFGSASWNTGKASTDSGSAWSYIDSITISGTIRGPGGAPAITGQNQSAILVQGDHGPVFLNVSNCFIYCNGVGVLVDSVGVPTEAQKHQINLIHDTFAWNLIGVWNGQLAAPIGTVLGGGPISVGYAHVSCINDIFDSTPPCSGFPTGATGSGTLNLEVPMQNQMAFCNKSLPAGMARWAGLVGATPVGGPAILLPYVHGMSNFEGLDQDELLVPRIVTAVHDFRRIARAL
jgi:hypothetical protein